MYATNANHAASQNYYKITIIFLYACMITEYHDACMITLTASNGLVVSGTVASTTLSAPSK